MNSIVSSTQRFRVIDSHTAGEPTRVLLDGGPELPMASVSQRRVLLAQDHDYLRRALVLEPRGSENAVGAVLYPPQSAAARACVLFFNNVGYLQMCVHGLIGVVHTMAYAGVVDWGGASMRFETPAGIVSATPNSDGTISIANVRSFRARAGVEVRTTDGWIKGDIAYGGNWFFIVDEDEHRRSLERSKATSLVEYAASLRAALLAAQIAGPGGEVIDHIQLTSRCAGEGANSRNFVLCPGNAYDRSPCGTGSSARVACLAADAQLAPGQRWVQESVIGSRFELSYEAVQGGVIPTVTGRAHIVADGDAIIDAHDPYRSGIVP